jgi:hypothetical protein
VPIRNFRLTLLCDELVGTDVGDWGRDPNAGNGFASFDTHHGELLGLLWFHKRPPLSTREAKQE